MSESMHPYSDPLRQMTHVHSVNKGQYAAAAALGFRKYLYFIFSSTFEYKQTINSCNCFFILFCIYCFFVLSKAYTIYPDFHSAKLQKGIQRVSLSLCVCLVNCAFANLLQLSRPKQEEIVNEMTTTL